MSPTFADLGLPPELVAELKRQNRIEPFPIQAATIPDALAGRDVLGRAPTGSGKTLAFGLGVIPNVAKAKSNRPKALILSPTRELAEQIRAELAPLCKAVGRSITAVYGGTSFGPQKSALNNGVDVLVACPGRLEDLINQGVVSLENVDKVIVDEADRMADMGFLPSVRRLLDQTFPHRQVVLFSATLDKAVQVVIDEYLRDPVRHEVGDATPDLTKMEHRFWKVGKTERVDRAAQAIDEFGTTIVFCRTRHGVDRLARQLKQRGVKSAWIHGGRSQNQRNSALHSFTEGKVQAMVATDVAARGIHVDGVNCVIHYDPPADHKDYTHRSGRTARAGGSGVAISFLMENQVSDAKKQAKKLDIAVSLEEPPPAPSWIKENQDAFAARNHGSQKGGGNKKSGSNKTGSKKKRKPSETQEDSPSQKQRNKNRAKQKASSSGSGDSRSSKAGAKKKAAKAKSSRSGRKRPPSRKGNPRKRTRGPNKRS